MKNKRSVIMAGVTIILMLVVTSFITFGNCSCPHQNGEELTDYQKLERGLTTALGVINQVQKDLPELYAAVDALCPPDALDNPEYCNDIPDAKKDVEDALAALKMIVEQALVAMDAWDDLDPAEMTSTITTGIAQLVTAYIKINSIIERHKALNDSPD